MNPDEFLAVLDTGDVVGLPVRRRIVRACAIFHRKSGHHPKSVLMSTEDWTDLVHECARANLPMRATPGTNSCWLPLWGMIQVYSVESAPENWAIVQGNDTRQVKVRVGNYGELSQA